MTRCVMTKLPQGDLPPEAGHLARPRSVVIAKRCAHRVGKVAHVVMIKSNVPEDVSDCTASRTVQRGKVCK
jgi:hypothetical protein